MDRKQRALTARVLFALLAGVLLLPGLGVERAAATGNGPDAGMAEDAGLKVYFPAINKLGSRCVYNAAPSIFGVQMYGETGAATNYYGALVDSSADWVRVPIEWRSVEPDNREPAKFRWDPADAAVAAAYDGCKNLIVTLRTAPEWAATYPQSRIDKASLDDFAQFVTAVVERYDGDGAADAPGSPVITYWELYNEPDASILATNYEGWGDHPLEYKNMLAKAWDAIKAANPNAKVVFGGIAYDYFFEDGGNFVESFLDDVLDAGGGAYFDIMNIHAYPAFGHVWIQKANPSCTQTNTCNGPGLYEKVTFVADKLKDEYGLDKPIMITESGWHSDSSPQEPSNQELQARYVTELYTQSKAAGVRNTIFFALADPGVDYPYESGLVTRDVPPKRKEAFGAYQTAVNWLAGAQFKRRIPVTEHKVPEMDVYQFYHPGRGHTFYVAWLNPAKMGLDLLDADGNPGTDGKPEVAERKESLRLPGATADIYDIYGNWLETVSDDDGDVRVLIGGQPRIIEIVK